MKKEYLKLSKLLIFAFTLIKNRKSLCSKNEILNIAENLEKIIEIDEISLNLTYEVPIGENWKILFKKIAKIKDLISVNIDLSK